MHIVFLGGGFSPVKRDKSVGNGFEHEFRNKK
jgi:hypothetical protein